MKFILILLFSLSFLFGELKIKDPFPTLTLKDQFDTPTSISQKGSTTLIISFEKAVSEAIKKYLETKPKGFLTQNKIHYISDISTMPSFITSMFALPKMKKLDFKISLLYDKKEGMFINRQKSKVSLFKLKNGRIVEMRFVYVHELDKELL